MPDISQLTGFFRAQQVIAGILLVLLVLTIYFGVRGAAGAATAGQKRLRALVGLDNRASTSRTTALMWTVVVGYCLLTLVLIALLVPTATNPPGANTIPVGWAGAAFRPLSSALLVQLGIPVASAVVSQIVVSSKVQAGTLQKTASPTAPAAGQLITDDSGNLQIADLQYVLFNAIAALYVLTQFIWHPARGVVDIPAVFGTLIGGSAVVYLGNKMLSSNPPVAGSLLATATTPGGRVTVTGRNLLGGNGSAGDCAQIALTPVDQDVAAPDQFPAERDSTDTAVTFTVPDLPLGSRWQVAIVTPANAVAPVPGTLRILSPTNSQNGAVKTAAGAKTAYRL